MSAGLFGPRRLRRAAPWVVVFAILLVMAGAALAQGGFELPWQVVAGGGGHAQGGSFMLDATIGQPVTGRAGGGAYEVCAGFWCRAGAAPGMSVYLPLVLKGK